MVVWHLIASASPSLQVILLAPLPHCYQYYQHSCRQLTPLLQYSDSVSYVGTVGQPVWGGFDSHHRPSTLDRYSCHAL